MAKLVNMFLLLIAIEACLILYTDHATSATALWDFVTHLDQWNNLQWIIALVGLAGAVSLLGITSGSSFRFITDFIVVAPAIAGLISIGVVFVDLANVVGNDLISRFFITCGALSTCPPAIFIIAITIGPIAFFYVWTVISWWRNTDF